jgi:two-component system phosphate regulon sensor histidine kinase PhoR
LIRIGKTRQKALSGRLQVLGVACLGCGTNYHEVEADPVRVERILFNLMENAAKYSPEDGKITVSSRTQGDFVFTRIIDHGLGISQDDQAKIFSQQTTKGVRLGLVVCKRLVDAQGGWIKVESELGKGSTFSVALPRHRIT